MNAERKRKLVDAFYRAALFLKARVDEDGWKWSSNFLREYVRCSTRIGFTNTESPDFLREVRRQHPELRAYIKIKPLKPSQDLFVERKKRA